VIASTLTTVAVFVPVVFLEGIAAQLFRDMALTVSFSLIASLAVSLTLIPMLAAIAGGALAELAGAPAPVEAAEPGRVRRVLRAVLVVGPGFAARGLRIAISWIGRALAVLLTPLTASFDRLLGGLQRAYPVLLGRALEARGLVLAGATVIFVAAMALVPRLGLDLIPSFSQGEFSYRVELPEGTPLEVTDALAESVQAGLVDDPRVGTLSSVAGGAGLALSRTGTEGENVASILVQMKAGTSPEDERQVIELLRSRLEAAGNVRYKFERPTYFSFRTPIEVEIYSDGLETLHAVAADMTTRVANVEGLVDVKSSAEIGNPELQVAFHRDRLANLGLDLFQVAGTIRNKVQGDVATRLLEGDREIDILVRSVSLGRASLVDVQDMIVGQREGRPIFLKSVADVRLAEGPSEIRRIGQKRAAVISANLSGRDIGSVAADIRREIAAAALPAGVSAFLSGQHEEMSRSLRSLVMAMALAIFLVYLVMASEFESFLHPFVIILTLPLGAVGAVAALFVTGKSIDVVAMIGLVMLAGIVVNNAIVLVDAVNQRRESGMARREALLDAASSRLRPILMTSSTTVLGLVPMALGLGEGAELRTPLAVTVIGGLAVATLLTLVVIPVVYSLVDRKSYAADAAAEAAPPEAAAEPLAGAAGAGSEA